MKVSITILSLLSIAHGSPAVVEKEPSLVKCCAPGTCPQGTIKYFSIDPKKDNCGETCASPIMFPLLHIFEKTLEESYSQTDSPCLDRGYTTYVNTPTHGAFGFSATLDLYAKPNAALTDEKL